MAIKEDKLVQEEMDSGPTQLWYSNKHYEHIGVLRTGRLLTGEIVRYSFTFNDKDSDNCWPDLINMGMGRPLSF